jgi:hypothetical protein
MRGLARVACGDTPGLFPWPPVAFGGPSGTFAVPPALVSVSGPYVACDCNISHRALGCVSPQPLHPPPMPLADRSPIRHITLCCGVSAFVVRAIWPDPRPSPDRIRNNTKTDDLWLRLLLAIMWKVVFLLFVMLVLTFISRTNIREGLHTAFTVMA